MHEILSRDAVEQVPFDEIIDDLVRVAVDSAQSLQRPVTFTTEGDAGELPAEVATPLAVVLQEILLNAVEHGFEESDDFAVGSPEGRIVVSLMNDGRQLDVTVSDNGKGFPEGFSIERSDSLGLSIVSRFVTSQLGGTIELVSGPGGGATVRLDVPLDAPETTEP